MASSTNPAALYNDAILDEFGAVYQPTLGPTWHHCVSLRLTMNTVLVGSVAEGEEQQATGTALGVRQKFVSITKSPISGPHSVPFLVAASGLVSPPSSK